MSRAENENGPRKYIIGSEGLEVRHHIAPAISATTRTARIISAGMNRTFLTGAIIAVPVLWSPVSEAHFNSRTKSRAVCQRSSGSFARQVFTTRSSAGGVIG